MKSKPTKNSGAIDIISPATACSFEEIEKIKNFVKKIGFTARIFLEKELTLTKPITHEFPSFKAEMRFSQLQNAIENTESKIIWCARGGYGSADLLPFLRSMKKPKNPKIFIGFSDISSLNLFLIQEWGWQVISSPVLAQIALNKVSNKSKKAIEDLLFGKIKELKYELIDLSEKSSKKINKKITGEIIGGCISVISSHFGTKNQINWQNKILFLEDEGEDGERLERYFNQIITIMVEQKKLPQTILLGNFLEANPHGTPKAKNIVMAIEKLAAKISENNLKIPLFLEKSKCLGHSKNMLPLILGREAIIDNGFLIQRL